MFESVTKKDKGTTPPWKVIPFMLLIAAAIGLKVCRYKEISDQNDRDREGQRP